MTPADWADHYRHFAAVECPRQPTYAAICLAVAADAELLALHAAIPPEQARANLFLAALHERLLAGVAHPLAEYYPSVGGTRVPDAELPARLRDFALGREREALVRHLAQRATQTNEAGRSAYIRLALDALGATRPRLALFDLGASAGLSLGVDADRIDYGRFQRGPGDRLALHCEWRGEAAPPPASNWTIVARAGMDLNPVDVRDPEACRWLEACIWTHDLERLQRLRRAIDWARAHPPQVQRGSDGLALLEAWMASLPADVQPVLLTSWVLGYLRPAALADFHARTLALVRERGLAWICAEEAHHHPLPLARADDGMLLSLHERHGSRALLLAHAHGAWAQAALPS